MPNLKALNAEEKYGDWSFIFLLMLRLFNRGLFTFSFNWLSWGCWFSLSSSLLDELFLWLCLLRLIFCRTRFEFSLFYWNLHSPTFLMVEFCAPQLSLFLPSILSFISIFWMASSVKLPLFLFCWIFDSEPCLFKCLGETLTRALRLFLP